MKVGRKMTLRLKVSKYSIFLLFIFLSFISCRRDTSAEQDEKIVAANKFMELRKEGKTKEAYEMLSNESREIFSFKEFDEYCFVFRVMEQTGIKNRSDGYYEINYKYYDKRFNKEDNELYTFYITENTENITFSQTGIVFPHTGFIQLRNRIEERDVSGAESVIKLMLSLDPRSPDVLESATQMGFIPEIP